MENSTGVCDEMAPFWTLRSRLAVSSESPYLSLHPAPFGGVIVRPPQFHKVSTYDDVLPGGVSPFIKPGTRPLCHPSPFPQLGL